MIKSKGKKPSSSNKQKRKWEAWVADINPATLPSIIFEELCGKNNILRTTSRKLALKIVPNI